MTTPALIQFRSSWQGSHNEDYFAELERLSANGEDHDEPVVVDVGQADVQVVDVGVATGDRKGPSDALPPPSQPMAVANKLVGEQLSDKQGVHLVRHWRGALWRWHTSHWLEMAEPALRAVAYRYTEHAVYLKPDPKSGLPSLETWAPNRYKIADLLDAMRAVTHLSETVDMPAWLDRDGHLPADQIVSCANGLLHVPTRRLSAHDPAYFNRVAVPFDYQVDPPTPRRWLAFLDELWPDDPEAIAALGEFFGYVISGRSDLHKIMLLIGPTRAGKGVIARTLKALVGKGNYAGPTLASLGTNFGLSPLIGKPLAIISDARLGGHNVNQVVERLLSVSGEDVLTVDVKYREPWTGTLPTRFLLISNELPEFGDASGAIANRFLMLALRHSWLGRDNTNLTTELIQELPGILSWALDGLERLTRQGRFTEPASSKDAILAMADLVSPASAFVRDRCTTGPGHEVACDALYAAWKSWADDNGHKAGSVQTFGRNLRAVLPSLRTIRPRDGDDRERRFQGVSLTGTYIGLDRGPSRTTGTDEAPVRDGPRPKPLSALARDDPKTGTDEALVRDGPRPKPLSALVRDDPKPVPPAPTASGDAVDVWADALRIFGDESVDGRPS